MNHIVIVDGISWQDCAFDDVNTHRIRLMEPQNKVDLSTASTSEFMSLLEERLEPRVKLQL